MKRFRFVILTVSLLVLLCSCVYTDPVLARLPACKSEAFYTSGGFQDYTDYAKYTYESVDAQSLLRTGYFAEVTAEDVNEIQSYLEDFEEWVATCGGELSENYDFDMTTVSAGNYFYIEAEDSDPDRKFYDYTIYYFDIDAQILYYFHNNI